MAAPAALAACGLALGCAVQGRAAEEQAPAAPGADLVTRRATLEPRMLLTGALEAVRSERIYVPRTPVWRVPIRWMEQDGALVTAGQRVLELDNSQFTADIEQKRLARSGAYNELARKEADVAGELFDKEYALEERRIQLAKARLDAEVPESLRPKREWQEFQLALARAEIELAKAEEDLETTRRAGESEIEELRIALRRAEDEVNIAEQAISALTLRAPRSGVLVVAENEEENRKLQVGDVVWVGMTVMTMPDLDAMQVVANLSDVDDGRIRVGQQALCTLDAHPKLTFTGTVREIAPIAQEDDRDSLRRSFRTVIALEKSDAERMRPGMSVRAEILLPPIENAIVAPRSALDLGAAQAVARLADGSLQPVRVGPCTPQACVIEEGLDEGTLLRSAG